MSDSLFDQIVNVGAYFDWITPTVSFLQDLTNGPSCGFGVPLNAFYSARDIKTLLNLKGIKVWGLMVVDDLIIFRVRKAQAQWALYVLETAQVPVAYVPRGLERVKRQAEAAPAAQSSQPGTLPDFLGWLR